MGQIFSNHFGAIRARLTAEGNIAKSFKNGSNKGNIREAFVRGLINDNTPETCSVGTGEIIHREMDADENRNQIDVILYNNRFPKLPGADGIDLFFVETVSSFIEIKSTLTKAGIRQAARASKKIKNYPYAEAQRLNPVGIVKEPRPFSFLFAYDATAKDIKKIAKWMREVSEEEDYNLDALKNKDPSERPFYKNLFLDGVFVLNKGFVVVDALPSQSLLVEHPNTPKDHIWIYGNDGELEHLWALINLASELLQWNQANLHEYLPMRYMNLSNLIDE